MTPAQSAERLRAAIDDGAHVFRAVTDAQSIRRARPDGWCAREIVGHLIDSACNNHRRFIVGQSSDTTKFDGYDQDAWVARQRYAAAPWSDLVTLWTAYNRHLAHVMSGTSEEAASHAAIGPDGIESVTVAFLMEDYVRHLRHHVEQVRELVAQAEAAG